MSAGSVITLLVYIVVIGGGCAYTMYRTLKGDKTRSAQGGD